MSEWKYVDVICQCGRESSIRIDQFNRKGGVWTCRSCAYKGRESPIKGKGIKNDSQKLGAYKSYVRAKSRVMKNHKGAYTNIEFGFKSFDQWFAELGPRPEGMSIDRINNNGHYEPGNVRWATQAEQNRNRRSNIVLEYNGEKLCMTDAARVSGIPYGTLEKRVKAGCPPSHMFVKGRWRYRNGALAPLNQCQKEQ